MPVDTVETHRVLTKAITGGGLRERAEEAAARVVALQMWQGRVAARAARAGRRHRAGRGRARP